MSTQISPQKQSVLQKHDTDVVIVSAVRSAITKVRYHITLILSKSMPNLPVVQGRKGGFKDTKPELILAHVLRAAYTKAGVDPTLIEDVAVGNCLLPGGGAGHSRVAAIHAGIPIDASVNTLNRQCASGLSAINQIANQIRVGQIEIGIGV